MGLIPYQGRNDNPTQPLTGPRLGVILPNQPQASHRAPQKQPGLRPEVKQRS